MLLMLLVDGIWSFSLGLGIDGGVPARSVSSWRRR